MSDKPGNIEDYLLIAYANFRLKNYGVMLRNTQKALEMKADSALAHHYKALALRGLGDLRGAEKAVKEALEIDKDDYRNVFLLGIIQWNSGEMEEAEKNLKKAVSYMPKEGVFLIEYATFLLHRGRFEEALDAAYKAKSIDPKLEKLNEVIASARQKKFKKGIDELTYSPPFPYQENIVMAHNILGDYYLKNGFFANAQEEYAEVIKGFKKNDHAMRGFATATRLKEGGFYYYANIFARFVSQWHVMLSIIVILGILAFLAYREPFFRMPAIYMATGIVIIIVFLLVYGLGQKSVKEYHCILQKWGVEKITDLMDKMNATQATKTQRQLQEEAFRTRAKEASGYSSMFAGLSMLSLLIQMIAVNIDTRNMDVQLQDNISSAKLILFILIISFMGLAIYFRIKSGRIMAQLEESETMETAKENGSSAR